jgi:hypothetical protein
MSQTVWRTCSCCGGSGRVELTGVYAEALAAVVAAGAEVTGAEMARRSGEGSATAWNNRLARLEQMGLLTGRIYGRRKLYKAAPAKRHARREAQA